ncbi:MAG TPA: BMP family ABC transporter substrate-binding protein [Anaerolineae bacterium]|nr:BMP family ABC transporter substrate-binding protein [Anaerolineae bacterium]HRJ74439.1 BMP family ABC transporter substrate-binding protein [Anaerolineales bacterium]
MKKLYFVSALLIIASMILAACGTPATEAPVATEAPATEAPATEAPTEAATEAPADVVSVGMVTDLGGIDDKSFNATAYAGIQQAIDELGVDGKYLESTQQSDYARNIQQFVDEGADLVVTVGFLLGVDTAVAAKANPDTYFTIVDYAYPDCFGTDFVEGQTCGSASELPNVLGLTFATDQASFLAGYAAAASTQTGKVGTWGGINIPPVTAFMIGFEAGVNYYNAQNGTAVEVLGWDTAANEGAFIGNFESLDDGRAITESLVQEGADIVMPVAGPAGLGGAAYCQETTSCWIIGVDTDWTVSASEYSSVILTSVLKNMNVAVFEAAQAVVNGNFAGGVYSGVLANNGVGLAPVAGASDDLNAQLEAVKQGLIDGSITITP